MLKANIPTEDLTEILKFGQTGILTEEALCAIGTMVEDWESRIDAIWSQMPKEQTGGTRDTDGYKLTSYGIEAWSEEWYCGSAERYDAVIPFSLFSDNEYVDRLREQREQAEREAETRRQQEQARRAAAKRKQDIAQLQKLKEQYPDA